MTWRGADDPAPDHDLPSDIAFRLWLQSLTPAQVARDREPVRHSVMERWVAEVRRQQ